jgi:predicted transglutaminase-like cysteine proteinase
VEFLRGTLFSRSTPIVYVLALFSGSGMGMLAPATAAETPVILAMGPGLSPGEQRPTPTLPRYFTINEILAKRTSQTVNTASNNQASAPVSNAAPQQPSTIPQGAEPFGLVTFRAPEGLLWVKWRKLVGELQAESKILARCHAEPERCDNPAAQKFLRLVEDGRKLPARARIDLINRTINAAVRYTTDLDQHGVPDLWSAPLATLSTGQGDCEDYAIAKYVALRATGVSADDLRLLLVHDRIAHQDHAVVGVRQNGRWLMLDNRHEVPIENKDAWHFTPLFALDQQGVKLFAAPYGAPPATAAARVASGPANTAQPTSPAEPDTAPVQAPELRLDTFEPPVLRGRM